MKKLKKKASEITKMNAREKIHKNISSEAQKINGSNQKYLKNLSVVAETSSQSK